MLLLCGFGGFALLRLTTSASDAGTALTAPRGTEFETPLEGQRPEPSEIAIESDSTLLSSAPPAVPIPSLVATGTDYQPSTLPAFDPPRGEDGELPPLGPLQPLGDEGRLLACLSAVTAEHPGTATIVDFARYRGDPALVMLLQHAGGSTVVVVGPSCNLGNADVLAAVKAD
jgi:hypothetical protein